MKTDKNCKIHIRTPEMKTMIMRIMLKEKQNEVLNKLVNRNNEFLLWLVILLFFSLLLLKAVAFG